MSAHREESSSEQRFEIKATEDLPFRDIGCYDFAFAYR
jgi:hypothetical protein